MQAATIYANLGTIHLTRGELDQAEAINKKALAVFEQLGVKPELAIIYKNLGVVANRSSHPSEAIDWITKARDLYEELGQTSNFESMQKELNRLGTTDR